MASERSLRMMSEEITGHNLASEEVSLSQPLRFWVDLRLSPLVYLLNLVGKVVTLVEQNARYVQIASITSRLHPKAKLVVCSTTLFCIP